MFQDDNGASGPRFPGDDGYRDLPPIPKPRVRPKSFPVLRLTPRSLALLDAVIAASADYDRTLAETAKETEGANDDLCLEAYGVLVQAKGRMAEYMATLMDRCNNNHLNLRRTVQVRYQ